MARRRARARRRAVAARQRRRRRRRPSSARSTPPSASPPAAATSSCSSTASTTCPPRAARRALAAARNIVDGGSLTIVATAPAPVGGETTIIALDRTLTRTGRFPALDLVASGTLRPELLVGDAGADAIAAGARRGARRVRG